MLRVASLIANARIRDQEEMESLISHLRGKRYLPMIRSMLTSMFDLVKLPEVREQLITEVIAEGRRDLFMRRRGYGEVLGELFFADNIICILLPLTADILQASVIGYGEQEQGLLKFCQDVEDAIKTRFDGRRVRGMSFNWRNLPKLAPKYGMHRYPDFEDVFEGEPEQEVTELKLTEPNYTPEDVAATELLIDTNVRQFILRLAQLRKMTSKDATQAAGHDITERLLSKGLVVEEYLLTCKQDQHTICIVPSRDHLNKEPTASLHCSCGRSFAEENLQVIYTLAEKAKKLVDSSLWMSIWITELLLENGVRREGIKWGFETGGEELDIMIEDFGSHIFLELKDREFGLGDAYPFVYRVTRYGGSIGIVATMDKVSTDAINFFKEEVNRRESLAEIRCLGGSVDIKEGIAKLVKDMSLRQARGLIQPFSTRLGFNLWLPVKHWIDTKMSEVSKTEA